MIKEMCKIARKTTEQFQKELNNVHNNEYTVLGEYINNRIKILIRHNICGLEWEVNPKNILQGSRCPNCNGHTRWTNDSFKKKVYELAKDEYSLLENYIGYDNKLDLLHNTCGNIYSVTPHEFIGGHRCPKCQHRSYKKTNEEYLQEVNNIWKNEFEILSEYRNANTKIDVKHIPCGNVYTISPRGLLGGKSPCRCNKESPFKKTDEAFKEELRVLTNEEYISEENYIDANTSILFRHIKCGSIFETTPHRFLSKHTRCPFCNGSKGEQAVQSYLDYNNLKYKREFTFDDCINKAPLPFDFAVIKDEKLGIIEFDGKQHFESIEWFGGQEGFEYTKHNDNIKNKYCEENNIPLLRIPYWDFNNINSLIDNFINEFKADGCQLF